MKKPKARSFNLSWYTISLRMIQDITDPVHLPGGIDIGEWLDTATKNEPQKWVCITNGPYRFCAPSIDPVFIRRVLTAFYDETGVRLPARIEREISPGQRLRLFLADDQEALLEFSGWVNIHAWRF